MKHPVPDEHLRCIGDMVVSFALLEFEIKHFVGSLINEHQAIGQVITAELSFKGACALVMSLYKERHDQDEDFNQLKQLLVRANAVEEKRNSIVHSTWLAGQDADHIVRMKTTAKQKRGLFFSWDEIGVAELLSLVKEIQDLAGELSALLLRLVASKKAINNPIKKTW